MSKISEPILGSVLFWIHGELKQRSYFIINKKEE